jgi:subtilase family serine protease
MKSSLLKTAIGVALFGLAMGAVAAPGATAAYVGMKNVPRLSTADKVTGQLASTQQMHIAVSLKLRNEAQLDAFLANPNHPILSTEQFMAMYSPTAAQAQSVAEHLIRSGFHNVSISPNHQLVTADGTPREAAKAFQVKMVQIKTQDGRDAYANSTDAKIPAELGGVVQGVIGLQTVHTMHTMHTMMSMAKTDGFHTLAVTGHNPTNFAPVYGDSSLAAATSVPVGIVTEGKLTNVISDLNQFTSANGLATVTTQTVNTGGTSTDVSGDGEWDLDSQDIVSISGGVQKIIFYNIPSLSNSALTADFSAIVSANAVKVVNVSLGECETDAKGDGSAASQDTSFKQADAQGQTISVSSGDSGADECGTGGVTPSWPAASQYVVAVGGTTLNASTTTWTSEVVWNDLASSEGATGGSPSTFEAMPSWQSGVGKNVGHTTRGVPDVAFDASPNSGALVIVDGAQQQIGGTSLASPLFVGTWARVLQAKGSTVGFAAPLIYADAAAHASDFHDVTSGNNSGETAAAGWDYTTGFGSIIGSSFVANVGTTGGGGGGTAPVASNGSVTTAANTPVNGTLSATGTAPLTFAVVTAAAHGTATITNASTGAFTYTPTSGFSGSDSFTFHATNSIGTSAAATESVTVTAASGSCATGYTSFTGSITSGSDVFEPNNTYYVTTTTGTQSGILSGPAGKDYDLYLYKWNGSAWRVVASSTGTTDNETINYSGTAGDYEWDIFAYSGSGTFQFCMKHPN